MEMERNAVTRSELLDRWRSIEEEDDTDLSDQPLERGRLLQLKEQWFSDAFDFLISLHGDNHVWCGNWNLMGPLLEPFYNYFKNEPDDPKSPLKMLYSRFANEMRQCTSCICKYHQAQETYHSDYEPSSITFLLDVLRTLDEERVSNLLAEINSRLARGEYDAHCEAEVVCVMFEVLMFPYLLDDQLLAANFEKFIEAIDDYHELTLTGNQQYPGVYALLFLKSRRARSIGLRLGGLMGKLRLVDLAPLQPLLKKCINFLENDITPLAAELPRPRVQLDRITVWLGVKALLGFLEPPAFEEGILERYPVFLSIVLNHISDDSAEFSYAVNCLRLIFEMLGCKLWLRSTLSPNVMRNTLIGQCFHTRNEKIHKEIFELLQPFLQSLEALQDGEHGKQRRHFLYFLLHQVTSSSNFSVLMRKKACQIAVLIVHRGYKMTPPSPPYECAHMWGPSLVSSLKDSSLHTPLRQSAFDLIQSIIVSDASVLVASILNNHLCSDLAPSESTDGLAEASDIDEMDASCWIEFHLQSRRTLMVYEEWMCIPMLWFDVLVGVDPLSLPLSFSKAVLWSISRFSMVELENSILFAPSSENWSATSAPEISHLFGWKSPSGYDDGECGTESRNSTIVSKMYMPLMRTFRRFASHFIVRMEHAEITKQWTWESMMAESIILLLLDPSDVDRETGRRILEKFSDKRGLTCGLQFLCSSQSSLAAVTVGVRHAVKLVQLDMVLKNFQRLHHFFFVLCKLLKEGNSSAVSATEASPGVPNFSQFSTQGGFLKQPFSDVKVDNKLSSVSSSEWEKFCFLISDIVWPSFQKCLAKGKAFINNSISQMTCIRLLEIFPVIFDGHNRHVGLKFKNPADTDWLHHLVDWGRSSLAVVIRYWKKALASLVGLLKETCIDISGSGLKSLENLISCENIVVDQLNEQVARLAVSLIDENKTVNSESFFSGKSLDVRDCSAENAAKFSFEDAPICPRFVDKAADTVIILSDDEEDPEAVDVEEIHLKDGSRSSQHSSGFLAQKLLLPQSEGIDVQVPLVKSKHADNSEDEELSKNRDKVVSGFTNTSEESNFVRTDLVRSECNLEVQQLPERIVDVSSKGKKSTEKVSVNRQAATSEAVEVGDESWEFSFFKSGKLQMPSFKQSVPGSKRQVIQLDLQMGNKSALVNREVERFKAPRLDDWYKLILELDYFVTVGLVVPGKDENKEAKNLKEVPVCFTSPDEYVKVFQPLVLEEFKAQLQGSFQEMASLEEMCCGSVAVLSIERIDEFYIVRCVHENGDPKLGQSCMENDLILFTRQKLASSSYDTHMVGKVERRELDNKRKLSILVIRLYLKSGCSRFNRARKFIIERSKWFISRLMSMTPQLREFQALSSIREIPLLQVILNPRAIPQIGFNNRMENFSKLPPALQHVLQSSYNNSQQQAISSALGSFVSRKDFDLSLIQGPPGTGKTRTIVGIISGLLALSRTRDVKKSLYEPRSTFTSSLSKTKTNQSAAIARSWQDATLAMKLKEDEERNTKSLGNSSRGRVLVCAHSNAAVDELVSRLTTEGLYGSDGLMYKPYLVRVGNAKTIHQNSLPFFIDTLVDERLTDEKVKSGKTEAVGESLSVLRSNLENLAERIRFYEAKRTSLRDGNPDTASVLEEESVKKRKKELSVPEIDVKLKVLNERKKATYSEISKLQAQERRTNEESKALKHNLRRSILKEAEIVVTTLSGCGGDLYGVCSESISKHKFHGASESTLFDAVVIDEAAQALEPATLIPLQLLKSRGTRCIMVGDPKQLPATVLSNIASKYSFQCSMFERLQHAGHPVIMLNEQYRMHPDICRFPASHFYDGKLLSGNQMPSKSANFHETKVLGPYVFFDVIDGQETHGRNPGSVSLCNECEADAAVEVLRYFKGRYPLEFVGVRIGIITPYKSQVHVMRSRFTRAFGSGVVTEIEFNTIDGFQGREVDILLLSTVRAAELQSQSSRFNHKSIGFLADVRRMNVALTRAKLSLWILGNARTLQINESWSALLKDARERNVVIAVRKPYSSIFRSSKNSTPPQKHADVDKRPSGKNINSGEKHLGVDDHVAATELQHCKKALIQKDNADVDKKLSGKNVYSGEKLLAAVQKHANVDKRLGGKNANSGEKVLAVDDQHNKKAAVEKHNAEVDKRLSGKNVNSGEKPLGSVKKHGDVERRLSGKNVNSEGKLLAVDDQQSKKGAVQKHNADVDKRLSGKNVNSGEKLSAVDEHAVVENKQCKGENSKKRKYNDDGANADNLSDKVVRKRESIGGGPHITENTKCQDSKGLNSSKYSRHHVDRSEIVKNSSEKTEVNLKDKGSSQQLPSSSSNKSSANQNIEKTKDKNMKRKEQRDAVDALLSSALISSKKPGSYSRKPSSQNRGAKTQR